MPPRTRLLVKLCTIAATSRSTRNFYDRISPFYDLLFTDHLPHIQAMADVLSERFPTADAIRVLDMACGTGALSRVLNVRGFRVTGLDFSFGSLRQLKENISPIGLIQADAAALPLDPSSFDVVTCMGAWRHFPQPRLVLEEIRRVLRSDGVFLVGYFPPKLGGLISAPPGTLGKVIGFSYGHLIRLLNYHDSTDLELEGKILELIEMLFMKHRVIQSGKCSHLILAESPR